MNLYYALGGGLGHLTRARAFLQTQNIEQESIILTSSVFADDKRIVGNIQVVQVDKTFEKDIAAFQKFLQKTISKLKITTIYLDSFPLGIIGEFANFDFQNIEINYVARLLRWRNYKPLVNEKSPRFTKTFILEPLENEHQIFINQFSKSQTKIELIYPVPNLSRTDNESFQNILRKQKPFWLIVHSGNDNEVIELVNYATEMREIEEAKVDLVLISPNTIKIDNLCHCHIYPASILFKFAARIFTACGFNAMNELKDFRDRHYFMPFERRFDDQFARAKLWRL